jgi:predicted RNA methylase
MAVPAREVERGDRFAFGANWAQFLKLLTDERVEAAERSLCSMLQLDTLAGQRFVDVGSGSGLFSLAARRLGASVHSFDYDPGSVWCTTELRRRFFPGDPDWVVDLGCAACAVPVERAYFLITGLALGPE